MSGVRSKKGILGRLLLLSATIVWGSSFVILKDTLDVLGNGQFTFFVLGCRFLVATLGISLVAFGKFKKMTKGVLLKGVALGLILYFAYFFQTVGLRYTTPSKNAFLTPVYCAIVPFMAWVLTKKAPALKNYVAAVLCIAGVAFVAFIGRNEQRGENELLGDMLTLICSFFYAAQITYNERFVGDEDPVSLIIIELTVCTLLFFLTSGVVEFPFHASEFEMTGEAVWKIVYLGIFATSYAQFAQLYGQKTVPATTASLILALEAVFGVLFDILMNGMSFTPFMIIGFVIIFIAEIVSELGLTPWKSLSEKMKNR
ncbi:MAG: DMT family transporter [Clostridia bacterium]|nr:DMT family transporter [Clostridia bacterium]